MFRPVCWWWWSLKVKRSWIHCAIGFPCWKHSAPPTSPPPPHLIAIESRKSLTLRVNKGELWWRDGNGAAHREFFFISHFYYRLDSPSANYKHPPKIVPFDLNLCDSPPILLAEIEPEDGREKPDPSQSVTRFSVCLHRVPSSSRQLITATVFIA